EEIDSSIPRDRDPFVADRRIANGDRCDGERGAKEAPGRKAACRDREREHEDKGGRGCDRRKSREKSRSDPERRLPIRPESEEGQRDRAELQRDGERDREELPVEVDQRSIESERKTRSEAHGAPEEA